MTHEELYRQFDYAKGRVAHHQQRAAVERAKLEGAKCSLCNLEYHWYKLTEAERDAARAAYHREQAAIYDQLAAIPAVHPPRAGGDV